MMPQLRFVFCGLAVAVAGMLALSTQASAQASIDAVDACIEARVADSEAPDSCIAEALAECDAVNPETPAVATLCFTTDAKTFNAGIAGRVASLAATATDEIVAIAQIETKYDILSALLQCSRIEELSLAVGRDTGEQIQRQDARCRANAAGLTYLRLSLRSAPSE